jgi:hypothetical protein
VGVVHTVKNLWIYNLKGINSFCQTYLFYLLCTKILNTLHWNTPVAYI